MNFKKSISKKSLLRRISGIALTLVMVINLMYGYSAAKAQVTEEARKASQVAAQKAEANKAPYRNVMYYGDWSIYSGQKNFTPDKIDGSLITHLNFAFMDADENGDLITTDTWADYENPNVGYSVGTDNKYAGVLGGMLLLRQKYPNMKIGISVGGWTRSGDFPFITRLNRASPRPNIKKKKTKRSRKSAPTNLSRAICAAERTADVWFFASANAWTPASTDSNISNRRARNNHEK